MKQGVLKWGCMKWKKLDNLEFVQNLKLICSRCLVFSFIDTLPYCFVDADKESAFVTHKKKFTCI